MADRPDKKGRAKDHDASRRSFLKKGLFGGLVLLVGGAGAIALRGTRVLREPTGRLLVFSREEHAIFAALARRVVAPSERAPSTDDVDVATRADHSLRTAYPSVQKEFKQLLRLFENGLMGAVTSSGLAPFTASSAGDQDARLEAWATSRVALFRTGYQAMKRLALACYYSAPESWPSIGYPGPPTPESLGAMPVSA